MVYFMKIKYVIKNDGEYTCELSVTYDDEELVAEALVEYLYYECDGWQWLSDYGEEIRFEYNGKWWGFIPEVEFEPSFLCREGPNVVEMRVNL